MQLEAEKIERIIRYWVLLQELTRQKEAMLKNPGIRQETGNASGLPVKVVPNLTGRSRVKPG